MVAKITLPQSASRALNYNENKVKQGKAECIGAVNFLKNAERLNFKEKLSHLNYALELNQKSKFNTLHISLNFHPKEQLNREKLNEIAESYMDQIGYGKQPYLVYKHNDAGHPHIHIVTTNIRPDGSRIKTHNIGKNQSEIARIQIEKQFNLVPAKGRKLQQEDEKQPQKAIKLIYGASATKQSISNTLSQVIKQYKFSSLSELNAVLRGYNLLADRGHEDGLIYKNRGLVYRVLDEKGNKIGVPIKASSFYFKPTLANLEKIFAENIEKKQPHKARIKTSIDWVLAKKPISLEAFKNALARENIIPVLSISRQGQPFGITFIDHQTRCVYKGSDLGKSYSARGIIDRMNFQQIPDSHSVKAFVRPIPYEPEPQPILSMPQTLQIDLDKPIEILFRTGKNFDYIPSQLKQNRKKKKRKNIHL